MNSKVKTLKQNAETKIKSKELIVSTNGFLKMVSGFHPKQDNRSWFSRSPTKTSYFDRMVVVLSSFSYLHTKTIDPTILLRIEQSFNDKINEHHSHMIEALKQVLLDPDDITELLDLLQHIWVGFSNVQKQQPLRSQVDGLFQALVFNDRMSKVYNHILTQATYAKDSTIYYLMFDNHKNLMAYPKVNFALNFYIKYAGLLPILAKQLLQHMQTLPVNEKRTLCSRFFLELKQIYDTQIQQKEFSHFQVLLLNEFSDFVVEYAELMSAHLISDNVQWLASAKHFDKKAIFDDFYTPYNIATSKHLDRVTQIGRYLFSSLFLGYMVYCMYFNVPNLIFDNYLNLLIMFIVSVAVLVASDLFYDHFLDSKLKRFETIKIPITPTVLLNDRPKNSVTQLLDSVKTNQKDFDLEDKKKIARIERDKKEELRREQAERIRLKELEDYKSKAAKFLQNKQAEDKAESERIRRQNVTDANFPKFFEKYVAIICKTTQDASFFDRGIRKAKTEDFICYADYYKQWANLGLHTKKALFDDMVAKVNKESSRSFTISFKDEYCDLSVNPQTFFSTERKQDADKTQQPTDSIVCNY